MIASSFHVLKEYGCDTCGTNSLKLDIVLPVCQSNPSLCQPLPTVGRGSNPEQQGLSGEAIFWLNSQAVLGGRK